MSKNGHYITKSIQRALSSAPSRLKHSILSTLLVCLVPGTVLAQTKSDSNMSKAILPPTDGLNLNMTLPTESWNVSSADYLNTDIVGLSSSLRGVSLDIPVQSVGSRLFDLDVANINCLTGDQNCIRRDETLDLGYKTSFTKHFDGKLDIQLMPRAALSFNDESSSAVVGALVRIGDDLREDSDMKANTWYMFAGADAEAVTYSPNSVRRISSGELHLQDRIIVGDAQAGIGYRVGDADLSLGYFRREVTSFGREIDSSGLSFKEDAAALSFTWRR